MNPELDLQKVIENIQEITGIKTKKEIGELLGFRTAQNFGQGIKDESPLLCKKIILWALSNGHSLDYIFTASIEVTRSVRELQQRILVQEKILDEIIRALGLAKDDKSS